MTRQTFVLLLSPPGTTRSICLPTLWISLYVKLEAEGPSCLSIGSIAINRAWQWEEGGTAQAWIKQDSLERRPEKAPLTLQPHNSPHCQSLQIGRRPDLYQDFGVVSELVSLGKNLLRRPPFRRPISLVPVHSNVILGSLNFTLRKSQEQS